MCASRGDFVISDNQSLQLLLLLITEGLDNNFDSLIANVITSEVKNSHSLAVGQSSLEFLDTGEADVITLEAQDLEVLLVLKSLAEGSSSVREHTVIGEPDLLNVFSGLKHLGNVSGTIGTNHIV